MSNYVIITYWLICVACFAIS